MSKLSSLLICTASLVLLTQMGRSQDSYPNFAPDNMNVIMSSHISGLSLQKLVKRKANAGQSKTQSQQSSGIKSSGIIRPSTATRSTAYRSSPVVTQKVRAQFLAWSRTQSPQEATQLESIFKKYNPIQVWQGLVKTDGLRTGDVADSLTAYWILNYLIATQGTDTNRTQALAVRSQIQPLLSNSPRFTTLTQAQKQELAEVWMLNFVVQQGAYGTAMRRGDKEMLRKLGTAAKARFQNEMKVDLTKLALTNKGLRLVLEERKRLEFSSATAKRHSEGSRATRRIGHCGSQLDFVHYFQPQKMN